MIQGISMLKRCSYHIRRQVNSCLLKDAWSRDFVVLPPESADRYPKNFEPRKRCRKRWTISSTISLVRIHVWHSTTSLSGIEPERYETIAAFSPSHNPRMLNERSTAMSVSPDFTFYLLTCCRNLMLCKTERISCISKRLNSSLRRSKP